MKILVVDDEPLAQQRLLQLLQEVAGEYQATTANTGLEAVEKCQQFSPDLVLLDIRMPAMDGIEAAHHISQVAKPPAIIFTTAYDEYALQAFAASAVDYLLKPVRRENLVNAINKAQRLNQAQLCALREDSTGRTNITAKISGNIKLIPLTDIIFFQAEQKYVTVRHIHGETIIEDTLKELQTEFASRFIRIHRNALVAKQFVSGIRKDPQGRSYVTLKNHAKQLEISRRHLAAVKKLLIQM